MRERRTIRYLIEVDGDAVEYYGQHKRAIKRAAIIRKTWKTANQIVVRDSWNCRPTVVMS